MAHPDYIAYAQEANRQPTVFIQVEDAISESLYYTTEDQWSSSDTLDQIDIIEEPGTAWHKRNTDKPPTYFGSNGTGIAFIGDLQYDALYDGYISNAVHGILFDSLGLDAPIYDGKPSAGLKVRVKLSKDSTFSTGVFTSDAYHAQVVRINNNYSVFDWVGPDFLDIGLAVKTLTGETWYVRHEYAFPKAPTVFNTAVHDRTFSRGNKANENYLASIREDAQVITSALDFGSVLTTTPTLSVDDLTQAGSSITYSYSYSTDSITYTNGGTIVDGDKLIPSRYYKIQADFFSTTSGRAAIREIKLSEGKFRWYGTHINEPFNGVLPYLDKDPVSTLNQKIKIGKGLSTTGELSVKIKWVDDTSDLIASGYLKGQDVSIFSGFVGLSTDAYEPVMVGTWYDHDLDEKNRVITVKIRDALKQFEKRKIPEEVVNNTNGAITNRTKTYTTTSIITVMKDIFDELGLRDRYISTDFDTLETGDYSVNKYKVSRVIPKPIEATKLIDELATTGSMFLIPLGNGQIKPKPFDINQDHSVELDATQFNISNFKGNISEFFSRFYAYYNPKTTLTSDPSDADDYDNGTALIDVTAETKWFPEKGTKQHFDKWKVGRTVAGTPLTVPPQALIDLNTLSNQLFTEPLYTLTLKQVPPRQANIEPADVIALTNLDLPVVSNEWEDAPFDSGDSFSYSAQTIESTIFNIADDGTKLYIISDASTEAILQYSMSTPWDITTASYDSKFVDISTEISSSPLGLHIKPDGSKIYVVAAASGGIATVFQYGMSTPFDLSTASYDSVSFNMSANVAGGSAIQIKDDGTKFFVTSWSSGNIHQYSMSTPWDITTASHDKTVSISGQDSSFTGLFISSDGRKLFTLGLNNGEIYQYSLGSEWDFEVVSYDGISFDVSDKGAVLYGVVFKDDGNEFFINGESNNSLYKYKSPVPFNIDSQTYTTGDKVIHDGRMWRARKDSTGQNPTSEAEFWQDTGILDTGLTDKKHFFVMGRKFNPNSALIDLDLMEMPPSVLGGFDTGFSSGFNV